jgi:hypothetical protein
VVKPTSVRLPNSSPQASGLSQETSSSIDCSTLSLSSILSLSSSASDCMPVALTLKVSPSPMPEAGATVVFAFFSPV